MVQFTLEVYREIMKKLKNIITNLHTSTQRDYLARMQNDKINSMKKANNFEFDYWDGNRNHGYGGYKYDGRWQAVAKKLIKEYNLTNESSILDVGCGKAFLLFEIKQILPQIKIKGFDISKYAIQNAKEEMKPFIFNHKAQDKYPYNDKEFDLTLSLNVIHNLKINEIKSTLNEIERVSKNAYIVVEGYRNEEELFNLECWALTCDSFFRPEEWEWLFKEYNYGGDYEFIYFI